MKKNNKQLGNELKLGMNIFLIALFGILFIWFLVLSFSISKEETINYSEKSDIDYRVYLKDNNDYDSEYLEKGNLYVANLVKNISIDFNYDFNVDKKSDIEYTYDIKAELVVYDKKKDKNLLSRDFILLDETKESMSNSKELKVTKNVVIDYDYYNDLVNSFKKKYDIVGDSYLRVYMNIIEDAADSNSYYFFNKNNMYVNIPLSEKTVDIDINTNDIDKNSKIISDADVSVSKPLYMCLSLIFFSIMAYFVNSLFKQLGLLKYQKNAYDKLVGKIIRNYDNIIIDTPTPPNKSLKIVRVKDFDELRDAHNMFQEPIMFYEISEHKKCEFYITHGNELYLYKVNLLYLEGKIKK